MADVKLTKTGLRSQQHILAQLKTYLPTLRLKKYLLQMEVLGAKSEIDKARDELDGKKKEIATFCMFFSNEYETDVTDNVKIASILKKYENIAGVEIPDFEAVLFKEANYWLFDTPIWFDAAIEKMKELISAKEMIAVLEEKKRSLEKELRDVSIRVNLFEKVLIPRIGNNIKKIKVFLGDQELAAVAQAKVAKVKIMLKR